MVCVGILIVLYVIGGCANRQRENPLDPLNPETQGRPTGLYATSEKHDVTLAWRELTMDQLSGYQIYRRFDGNENFEAIQLVPPQRTQFTDAGLPYDQKVTYRISVVSGDYESPLSDSVSITPGPYNYWMVDAHLLEVIRLTYDVQNILMASISSPYPVAVAADSLTKSAWVIDLMGSLVRLSSSGDVLLWVDGLVDPKHICVDPFNGVVWVSDYSGSQVARYDTLGNRLGETSGFIEISDMDCTGGSGGCWIVDRAGKSAALLSLEGVVSMRVENTFDLPVSVSFYRNGDWAWVAADSALYRVRSDGQVEEIVNLDESISRISAVQSTGDCWMIAAGEDADDDEIVKIDSLGNILARVAGFSLAQDLIANDYNGGCLVADTDNYRIVRLSGDGEVIDSHEGIGSPWSLSVE